ncbi:PepSY-associated TM helix domain-containing protein [Thalassobaculum sp. OXR-137]|uniref:PepSY-associated TM helix domain-containing protein n=1 Tax=Thalassobaculum sp. OXR-137 TaxID=3100173 RepID=UPI002AC89675|nr:PepSY-associated TM helix domain-containing protein [Thalassobaculum sp. OXR-137]WPZ35327.1 PepSY-associated TM helix domain-containing protein [Thalassobaculum sp. OXR-137]
MSVSRSDIATVAIRNPAAPRPAAGWGRAFWLRQIRLWHWVSAALSLIGMVFFAATGITLNHAADIPAAPQRVEWTGTLPPALAAETAAAARRQDAALPDAVADWLAPRAGIDPRDRPVEWSAGEAYVALPRPGGDAWVAIALPDGAVTAERTSRGPVAFLNDLHKGRDTGDVWRWFIDAFAGATLIFSLTGLGLLWLNAGARPSTWPLVGFGLLAPVLLVILFIH